MEPIRPYRVDYVNSERATIDVYVTVPGRMSRVLYKPGREMFKEIIMPRAFAESIHKYGSVPVMLNHEREIANSKSVDIWEDDIGLRAIVKTNDIEILAKILSGHIVGCSFGFNCLQEKIDRKYYENIRMVEKLKLNEVSFIDDENWPAYNACSIINVTIPNKLQNDIMQYRMYLVNK